MSLSHSRRRHHRHGCIPRPGTFCKAMISIPTGVSTAAYSHSVHSGNSVNVAESPPQPRLCYVHQRLGNLFSVHFCTGFGGSLISTQFSDHPIKREKFLAIAPTISHNDIPPLITTPRWDRSPAYLCLGSSVEVEARNTQPPNETPPPALSEEERRRLDNLIAEANPDFSDSASSGTPSTDDYDEEFPPLILGDKRPPISPAGNIAKAPKIESSQLSASTTTHTAQGRISVERWIDSVGKDWSGDYDSVLGGYDSDEEGFSPEDFLRARLNPTLIPQVTFSTDLSEVNLDEADPAAEFVREAIRFHAVRAC